MPDNAAEQSSSFKPFVSAEESPPEFTIAPIIVGALLGIVFGASSVYLVLKVGLTISASIPVAVLAMAVFRILGRTSILQNNIVQTTGSAGESIAFGIGLTMPALLLLGYDIDVLRVMTVGVLGGLLGILMMIPLRRAFIVKKHGELKYPEGTACAEVLIAGETGGATAITVFSGFIVGFVYQFLMLGLKLWKDLAEQSLSFVRASGQIVGLKGGVLAGELSAPLLGVGYIIGPRIACIMVAGGVLAYLVLTPAIVYFGENLERPLPPAISKIDPGTGLDHGLIRHMSVKQIRDHYILYIGAGAVAAGGIIAMLQALPVIISSVASGLRDMTSEQRTSQSLTASKARTDRDLPLSVVIFGSLGLVIALMVAPSLGLGLSVAGVAGAVMIVLFGFLFVTVSSRLTGEIGSSSNPISGMTVATLLLTCLVLLVLSEFGIVIINKEAKLTALTIASVVCIACSNGGTTSQALKTGYLIGATPRYQQYAILIGSLTSALVVGGVLIALNQAGTVYTKRDLPTVRVNVALINQRDYVRTGPYAEDKTEYHVLHLGEHEKLDPRMFHLNPGEDLSIPPGRYLVAEDGTFAYRCDPAVNGRLKEQDNGNPVANKFDAPKTQLIALIIDGVLDRELPWDLVLLGVLIAVTLELAGVPALPFAVGVYLPLSASTPIFIGGTLRWLTDKIRHPRTSQESDSSPGVLLSSGYIAGGAIAAVIVAFFTFAGQEFEEALNLSTLPGVSDWATWSGTSLIAFSVLGGILFLVGLKR